MSGERRLQREKRELKTPQERSDEETEAVPAESVRSERKYTDSKEIELFECNGCLFLNQMEKSISIWQQESFMSYLQD